MTGPQEDNRKRARRAYIERQVAKLDGPEVLALLRSGLNEKQVGDRFGVQRHAVGEVIHALGVTGYRLNGDRKRADGLVRKAARRVEQEAARALSAHPCAICGAPVGAKRRTCGGVCAEAWVIVRYQIDPESHERQRLRTARRYLEVPEKYPDKQEWAQRLLEEHPPPNRRFVVPSSHVARVLAQVNEQREKSLATAAEPTYPEERDPSRDSATRDGPTSDGVSFS